ncbi:MAG TPA: hypothetical protein VGU66_02600 [Candidatus Elarobacter sp.]|nr:hypothetical protein [Candidatus Elarobacter sp.]
MVETSTRHRGTHRRGVLVSSDSAARPPVTMSPVPPQYEPDQIAAIHADELEKRRQPATPATWALGITLVLAAAAWIVMVALRLRA